MLVFKADYSHQEQLLATRAGIAFGQITALSVLENGTHFIVGTESGELISFDLLENLTNPGQ